MTYIDFDKMNRYKVSALKNVETIFNKLNIESRIEGNKIRFKCPIHEAHKDSSSCIYLDQGVWMCFSQNCHVDAKRGDLLGLLHSIISKNNENLSEDEVWNETFLLIENTGLISKHICPPSISDEPPKLSIKDKDKFHPKVIIPSKYYIDRGIKAETLKEFGVGDCQKGVYNNKAVIPVEYIDGEYMGFTARSHFPECPKCGFYHHKYEICVHKSFKYKNIKMRWVHGKGTQTGRTMYGINKLPKIDKVVVVEGISCVWRLWENDIAAVGCYGTSGFNKYHAQLLKDFGIKKILIAADNDEAGKKFKDKIKSNYSDMFQAYPLSFPTKDIGDMTNEQITKFIKNKWDLL